MIETGGNGAFVGHVQPHGTASARPRHCDDFSQRAVQAIRIDVREHQMGAGLRKLDAGRQPDRARGSGHQRDLARKRLLELLAQLGLLQAPVLDVEEIGLVERLVAAERLGCVLDPQRVLGDVRRDDGILARLARADDSQTRNEEHARIWIELATGHAFGAHLAGEVSVVTTPIACDRRGELRAERIRILQRGLLDEEMLRLGANDVVGGERPPGGKRGALR